MQQSKTLLGLAFLLCSALPLYAADITPAELETSFSSKVQPFLTANCVSCHSGAKPKGQVDLTAFPNVPAVVKAHQQWGTILELLKAKEMPPKDAKQQPTDAQRAEVIAWIEALTKFESQKNAGDPGLVLARRLSNAEYDYTIRDLTGVDMRPTKEFPVDPANEAGFDNSGESLSMSPALVKKYLDAAHFVAEHIVLKPNGFDFAPYAFAAETDRDKYAVRRIIDFYERQRLDYADYFEAAWRYQHRALLGQPQQTLADVARPKGISAKYLGTLHAMLTGLRDVTGPIASLQAQWNALPSPRDGKQPPSVRPACEQLRVFVVDLREKTKADFRNLPVRGLIASGSQSLVLWKNQQFATHRMAYVGGALEMYDAAPDDPIDPAMIIPEDDAGRAAYEASFKRFCSLFPDTFYVSERSRVFLENPRERAADKQNTGRYLSAGFHSQNGYFRDDQPLYALILDESGQRELDMLWRELDFITLAPLRQIKEFIWFERAEPPSYMYSSEFNNFRSEDDDIVTEAKIRAMAEVYLDKARRLNVGERGLTVVAEYFETINANIRRVEKDRIDAEPKHLDAMLALAEKAYRRPLTSKEREGLLGFYRSLRSQTGLSHEDAIRDTVASVLMAPYFLYRVDPSDSAPGTRPLNDYELASRLSYFLWSSMPDAQLLARAAAGELKKPPVLVAEAKRMLKDDRIRGFATEFAGNWLDVRRFEEHNAVDRDRFPQFTNELRESMFEEPIHFFVDLVQNDRSVMDLVYGDYTFVNPALAKHYGIPVSASPDEWVRVDNASRYHRGGLMPMSVFLTKNAPGLRTSPVKRGYWVVRRLLGEVIPPPPPNVPDLPSDETKLGDLTLAQALAKHREDPSCGACHERFDSFGLVFEAYGPIGEWRTKDLADRPVQTVASFPKGAGEGEGLEGLRRYIREHREGDFVDNLARKTLVYSLGRGLQLSDEPLVAEMRDKLKASQYRFGSLVEVVITSPQFLTRRGTGLVAKE